MDNSWDFGGINCYCLERMEVTDKGWVCPKCAVLLPPELAVRFTEWAFESSRGNEYEGWSGRAHGGDEQTDSPGDAKMRFSPRLSDFIFGEEMPTDGTC
jgi:hypothetical protein